MPYERVTLVERGVESSSGGKRSLYSPQVSESPMNISLRAGHAGGGSSWQPSGRMRPSKEAMPIHDSVRRTSSITQPSWGAGPVGKAISLAPGFRRISTGSQPLQERLKKQ